MRKISLLSVFVFITVPAFSQQVKEKERIYSLKKGRHHASHLLKNRLFWHIEDLHWHTYFDSTARYILRNPDKTIDVDQYDWSKLPGITFSPLHTLQNTAMVGWRYNIAKDSIELIPYFHVNGQRIFQDEPHLTVGINEPFDHEIHLNYEKKEILVSINTARGSLSVKKIYKTFRPWVVQIHPFFGGNKKAPQQINIHTRMEKEKWIKKN